MERRIRRRGAPVTIRRKVGALNSVTSMRSPSSELEVTTIGWRRRRVERSAKGDPLSTEEVYYVVPAGAFRDLFAPRDSDLVMDGQAESRVLFVRSREGAGGVVVSHELYVSGVAL